jgi:hypothetical protein
MYYTNIINIMGSASSILLLSAIVLGCVLVNEYSYEIADFLHTRQINYIRWKLDLSGIGLWDLSGSRISYRGYHLYW